MENHHGDLLKEPTDGVLSFLQGEQHFQPYSLVKDQSGHLGNLPFLRIVEIAIILVQDGCRIAECPAMPVAPLTGRVHVPLPRARDVDVSWVWIAAVI